MLKYLKYFLIFQITVQILLAVIISFVSVNPGSHNEFFKGFYEGVMGHSNSLTREEVGEFHGKILFSAVPTILLLMAIVKRSKSLKNTALIFYILIILSYFGQGRLPVLAILIVFILLVKNSREYWDLAPVDKKVDIRG